MLADIFSLLQFASFVQLIQIHKLIYIAVAGSCCAAELFFLLGILDVKAHYLTVRIIYYFIFFLSIPQARLTASHEQGRRSTRDKLR